MITFSNDFKATAKNDVTFSGGLSVGKGNKVEIIESVASKTVKLGDVTLTAGDDADHKTQLNVSLEAAGSNVEIGTLSNTANTALTLTGADGEGTDKLTFKSAGENVKLTATGGI